MSTASDVAPQRISRVVLRDYRSIGACDVYLQPLTVLVGANGSGKSNFLDALHLVRDALSSSLDNALNERGGLAEIRRRSSGHPTDFGIRLEFTLKSGQSGHYAFIIGARRSGSYEVKSEECVIEGIGRGPAFKVERGVLQRSSEETFPALTADRLALVSVSGMAALRPVFDLLTSMSFYNLNPKLMRDLQKPQEGRLLKPVVENIASVIGHLERVAPDKMTAIREYLQTVVPTVHDVERKRIGPMETIEFRQDIAGAKHPWRFLAQNMSDGTLRVLGVLTALFQGNLNVAPSLVGIEEPETALHPAASAALREALALASRETQVQVTSHSPDLLDDPNIDPNTLLAVSSKKGNTQIAPLDKAAGDSMRDHLFSAGELLRLDQLEPDMANADSPSIRRMLLKTPRLVATPRAGSGSAWPAAPTAKQPTSLHFLPRWTWNRHGITAARSESSVLNGANRPERLPRAIPLRSAENGTHHGNP